jgi:hypothetical protein
MDTSSMSRPQETPILHGKLTGKKPQLPEGKLHYIK